jgi:flagellar protein FlbD
LIVLTTLKGRTLAVNDELIERVEDGNDTRIVLTNGNVYIVRESLPEVVDAVRRHRADVQALARSFERRAAEGEASRERRADSAGRDGTR